MLSCPFLRERNRKIFHLALWFALRLPLRFPPHSASPTLQHPKIRSNRGHVCDEGLQLRSLSTQNRKRITRVVQRPQRWVHTAGSQIGQPLSLKVFQGLLLTGLLYLWALVDICWMSEGDAQQMVALAIIHRITWSQKEKMSDVPDTHSQWIGRVIGSWSLAPGPKMTRGPMFFDDVTSSFSHIPLLMSTWSYCQLRDARQHALSFFVGMSFQAMPF